MFPAFAVEQNKVRFEREQFLQIRIIEVPDLRQSSRLLRQDMEPRRMGSGDRLSPCRIPHSRQGDMKHDRAFRKFMHRHGLAVALLIGNRVRRFGNDSGGKQQGNRQKNCNKLFHYSVMLHGS